MGASLKRVLVAVCVLGLAACAEEPAEDELGADAETEATTARSEDGMEAEGATTAGALSAEDLMGTWNVTAYGPGGDSLVSYRMDITGDPSTWTVTFPGDNRVQARDVMMRGDSVTMTLGPYSSALREGAQVTTRTVGRLEGGRMVGQFVARYETGADSVLRGRFVGTRAN